MKSLFKKIFFVFYVLLNGQFSQAQNQISVVDLRTQNLKEPLGIDTRRPNFSWKLKSANKNVLQTAYEIILVHNKVSLWNTGKIISSESIHVSYKGDSLRSDTQYGWKVRVWDNLGNISEWSSTTFFRTAFFEKKQWKANWIEIGFAEDSIRRPVQLFRKEFSVKKKIASATLYISAHGLYEAQINGKKVGEVFLTPGWTSYNTRLQYQAFDVTNALNSGNNAIGVSVGNGWYRGNLAYPKLKNVFGKSLGLLAQINITYSDGSKEAIITDQNWKCATGAIKFSELYHGEIRDANLERNGWANVKYNDEGWNAVIVKDYSLDNLVTTENELVKKQESLKAVKYIITPKGEKVIDFGQNMVGWAKIKISGNKGDSIIIKHAEVLDKKGNFYTENLRTAKATATYILKGEGTEILEPSFTFFGFRYIKLDKFNGAVNLENFSAEVIHSDIKPTGSFSCSNPLINQLQHNIQWSQKGNFLDIPTDCPQRDERLGWTGDAQMFSRTAIFNFDVHNFLSKWMKDLAADQQPNGMVPYVVPNVLGSNVGASTGWADAATIIPWNLYITYGDTTILRNQYSSMKSWIKFMTDHSTNNLYNQGFHHGDWLNIFGHDINKPAYTDKYLIAQCFYANSVQIIINSAKVLKNTIDEKYYIDLLAKIKKAFVDEYITGNGRLVSNDQTAYALALNFDILPETLRKQAAERLANDIKNRGYQFTTGLLGILYLCPVLTRYGYHDVATKLLMREKYPSWLYPVKMGATTIWERWDGMKPDSSFQDVSMNSFNHYAFGVIGDWMYRDIAGLDTYEDEVAYKHIKIKPNITQGLTNAKASLETSYGLASSSWVLEKNKLTLDITIPPNTYANVFLPNKNKTITVENGHLLEENGNLKIITKTAEYIEIRVGSGNYQFILE